MLNDNERVKIHLAVLRIKVWNSFDIVKILEV